MTKKEEPVADVARVFPLSVLKRECRKLFDVSASTFDGATHGMDPDKEYAVEDIKKAIETWRERRV